MSNELRIVNRKPFRPPLTHDHFDGCKLLLPWLPKLFELANEPFPFSPSIEKYTEEIRLLFRNAHIDIVKKFKNTTGVMQCGEALELAAYAYTTGRAKEGYTYCEATIAPQYHVPLIEGCKNFSELFARHPHYAEQEIQKVVPALIAGIKRGEKNFPQIEVDLILAIGREVSPEIGVWLVDQFVKFDRDYVVGIGLVCDEAAHPPEKHILAFRHAKELGFKTTVHAGEWVHLHPDSPNPERDRGQLLKNMRTAILDLGADRIGHAIPLAYDRELMRHVVGHEIGIEWCPGSNFVSGLIPNMRYLGLRALLQNNVLGSLNPDDDLFLPDLDETLALCNAEYNFTEAEKWKLEMNAWATRFGRRKQHRLPFESDI